MKILADENIARRSISRLRDRGYDVISAREVYPSEAAPKSTGNGDRPKANADNL